MEGRGDLLQRLELRPGTALPGDEQAARFGPGVERAVRPADRHREHVALGKLDQLPAPTAVRAQSGAVALGPDQNPLAVRCNAGGRDAVQHRVGSPRLAVPVEARHAVVAGAEVGRHPDQYYLGAALIAGRASNCASNGIGSGLTGLAVAHPPATIASGAGATPNRGCV